jgi:hypothetical protein
MSKDIAVILNGWDYNPDEVTVRRILGLDGRVKIQMRLDLGILQMEVDGRPDGQHPHDCDSVLEFYNEQLRRHRELNGDTQDFTLNVDECSELKQEAMQYYYRYLSLFHLGDYWNVIRDTDHNLQLLDLVREYAIEEGDRMSLEQFRPYVIMMNTRARACLALEDRTFDRALEIIDDGIEQIEDFLRSIDRSELIEGCREIVFLQEWSERIRNNRPLSREEKLRQELRVAVEAENYERAAQLRDEIRTLAM